MLKQDYKKQKNPKNNETRLLATVVITAYNFLKMSHLLIMKEESSIYELFEEINLYEKLLLSIYTYKWLVK